MSDAIAPHAYQCPKCKYDQLLTSEQQEIPPKNLKCPNCKGPLWKVSWKEYVDILNKRAFPYLSFSLNLSLLLIEGQDVNFESCSEGSVKITILSNGSEKCIRHCLFMDIPKTFNEMYESLKKDA